jgi:hypothetical protein
LRPAFFFQSFSFSPSKQLQNQMAQEHLDSIFNTLQQWEKNKRQLLAAIEREKEANKSLQAQKAQCL